jgi:2-polyprenyl-3-methyl-5-hydroxy-6-metoxy-1,4-benzoquinol methylase
MDQTERDQSQFHDFKYETFGRSRIGLSSWHRAVVEALARIGFGSGQRLLELGCGNGVLQEALRDANVKCVGTEVSREAVRICLEKGLDVRLIDFEKDPVVETPEAFDAVVMTEVIEHIFDIFQFVAAANANLKPSGYLVLTTPEFFSLPRLIGLLKGKCPTEMENPTHIRFFTFRYIEQVLKAQGFEVAWHERARGSLKGLAPYFDKLGLGWLVKWLYNRLGATMVVVARKAGPPRYASILPYIAEYHTLHYGT